MHPRSISDYYLELKSQESNDDLPALLGNICREFGLNNLSYVGLVSGGQGEVDARIFSTYDPTWVDRYDNQNYHLIDPVVHEALNGVLPVDWGRISKNEPDIRNFFGEASEFGVCDKGLSIPLSDPANGKSVLTVNSDMSSTEWNKYKQQIVADVMYLGALVHNDVVANDDRPIEVIKLTRREKEVLKWAAIGKTAWETGQIVGITERTVTHHLNNACLKLKVSNKTHAVVKAIQLQEIVL
jgi:DNA-binding CsgD family transcriptional regulator